MSLLLDALKKAADEKKNSTTDAAPRVSTQPEQDLPGTDNTGFPDTELQLEAMEEENLSLEEITPPTNDNNDATTDPASPAVTESFSHRHSLTGPGSDDREPQRLQLENTVALSALINKSNQLRAMEKRRHFIAATTLIFLVTAASALFFYFDQSIQSPLLALDQPAAPPLVKPTPLSNPEPATAPTVTSLDTTPIKSTPSAQPVIQPRSVSVIRPTTTDSVTQESMQIIHRRQQDPVDAQLNTAYAAFQRSDDDQASKIYQQVLQQEPDNRDALLGLAAIAIRQQSADTARQLYQQLLSRYPGDTFAIAGLSSLEQGSNSTPDETRLNTMLRQQPDAAHLHFALGSLYARQARWPEAQSAYFSAWSLENQNPDYTYNLAVSLDHLGKQTQAIEFYTRSLQLAQQFAASFSIEDASQRIHALRGSAE